MTIGRWNKGDRLVFTGNLTGVCTINKGDTAIYLGNSQIRMTNGPSKDWLATVCFDAPIIKL